MTIAYVLAANPIWYVADLVGRPAGGASLYSWRSLNKTIQKPIYTDSSGAFAYSNPILFDNNGQTEEPFYFADDEAYYLQIFDAQGNLIWDLDNFTPSSGGGGGTTTVFQSLSNYVGNNVFFRNSGTLGGPASFVPSGSVLAPGNHEGFSTPDTTFIKDNNTANDQILFTGFALDDNPLTGDVTPEYFLQYKCTTPAVESYKYIRCPINWHVNSFENQIVTVSLWGLGVSGTQSIQLNIRQYFGQGGTPSADVVTPVGTPFLLTTGTWKPFIQSVTIPAIPGGTVLGTCGDDAVFLELSLPLNSVCNIGLTKPTMFLGNLGAGQLAAYFEDYDQIDSIIDTPRTGDIRTSYQATPPLGWILMDDGSIGSATSGASNRANIDTFQLYSTMWNNVSDADAPVAGGRGATAVADFTANKKLTLPLMRGRVIGGTGTGAGLTARALGDAVGAETHAISIPELPSHTHTFTGVTSTTTAASGGGVGAIGTYAGTTTGATGSGTAMSIMQPTTFQNTFIKL